MSRWVQRFYTRSHAHTRNTHRVDCGTCIDSVPREIYNVLEATRSGSSNRDEELANRELKDTTITKRQLDLATRMMLEQVSCLSDGDYERSAMFQLFLDCVDRAIASSTALVFPKATHSCCHGEVWRQNAEAKMKTFLAFTLFGCTGRQLLSMASERARRVES